MNNITGRTETSTTILYLSLPAMILHYIGDGISKHNSGYWINLVLYSLAAFFLLIIIKKPLSDDLKDLKVNKLISKIIEALIFLFVAILTFYNFKSCANAVYSVTGKAFSRDMVVFLPLIASLICSLSGIEAITRSSYIFFFICFAIVLFMCIITFDGWKLINIYPLFGNGLNNTFSDYFVLGLYSPIVCVYALRSNTRGKNEGYFLARKAMLIIFLSALILGIVCILTIPYPMGSLYGFSLKGIFSIADSGSFFHRFEILLSFMLLIIDIVSVSVGIYIMSMILSNLTGSNDYKPFCLILSLIILYLDLIFDKSLYLLSAGGILSAVIFILLSIQALVNSLKKV